MRSSPPLALFALSALALGLSGCPSPTSEGEGQSLTVYCGRSNSLVDPILKEFAATTGIEVKKKYAKTAPLAMTIMTEGANSPADVFFAQDAGALGALSAKGLLAPLPKECLGRVAETFRAQTGDWVGVSGRARVLAYSTIRVKNKEDLPKSIWELTEPKWKGRVGWPPKNASFQAFVTALRVLEGEAKAEEWLTKMQANEPKVYPKNTPIIAAINAGEIDVGLVNHYYLYRFLKNQGSQFPVRNYHFPGGDSGSLINIAGVAILKSSKNPELARRFVEFLLSKNAQRYFANETHEYPLAEGVEADGRLQPLSAIEQPKVDLNRLSSLEATLELLRKTKVLK